MVVAVQVAKAAALGTETTTEAEHLHPVVAFNMD
jgi:hypothetical protein